MKIMALEFSTDRAGLALLCDGEVLARTEVDARYRRSQEIFPAAERLLAEAGTKFAEVDGFAVGRGPGSYTGLRTSVTAATGWAVPEGKFLWAVSSGAALAAELLADHPEAENVAVWGDARRGTVWAGQFERAGGGRVRQVGDWQLVAAEDREGLWPGVCWAEAGRAPKAEWVGRLFFAGGESEEILPLYLHPAVGTAPRFDADGKPLS